MTSLKLRFWNQRMNFYQNFVHQEKEGRSFHFETMLSSAFPDEGISKKIDDKVISLP